MLLMDWVDDQVPEDDGDGEFREFDEYWSGA